MSKEHAYAYEAGYRDGSTNYELEHCPACKNVANLQDALDENTKLRQELEIRKASEQEKTIEYLRQENVDWEDKYRALAAENAKLQERIGRLEELPANQACSRQISDAIKKLYDYLAKSPSVVYPEDILAYLPAIEAENRQLRKLAALLSVINKHMSLCATTCCGQCPVRKECGESVYLDGLLGIDSKRLSWRVQERIDKAPDHKQNDLLTEHGMATTAYLLMAMSIDSLERKNKQLEEENTRLMKLCVNGGI